MVQLPATAAIKYVAACCRTRTWKKTKTGTITKTVRGVFCPGGLFPLGSFARRHFWPGGILAGGIFVRGCFCPGGLLPGETFVRGAYARSPQVQRVYASLRLSVPSIVAWRTSKQTNKTTNKKPKKDKLGPVAPRGVDPHFPNFQGM